MEEGKSVLTLSRHTHPVTSLSFNPNGDILVTASHQRLLLWSIKDGSLIKSFKSEGGVNDVSWDSTGTKIAACYSDNTAYCIDLRV